MPRSLLSITDESYWLCNILQPLRNVRSILSLNGKNASEPRVTSVALGKPCFFLFLCKYRRLPGKDSLPFSVCQYIHVNPRQYKDQWHCRGLLSSFHPLKGSPRTCGDCLNSQLSALLPASLGTMNSGLLSLSDSNCLPFFTKHTELTVCILRVIIAGSPYQPLRNPESLYFCYHIAEEILVDI